MFTRTHRAILAALLLASAYLAAAPARAIEVECIEASKYKHLVQLFGNDRRKFAEFLNLDLDRLPDPESCRAVLLSGPIGPSGELDKLLRAIEQNRGGLTTIYLASNGGNVYEGRRLAQAARMFWLKTVAFTRLPVPFRPDFVIAPLGALGPRPAAAETPSPETKSYLDSWQSFITATEKLPQVNKQGISGSCVSACSLIFAAGVDRQGIVYVHRPRFSSKDPSPKDGGLDLSRSMSDTVYGLQIAEMAQVAVYQHMDVGEEFVRIYQGTPTNITNPATSARTPRFAADLLLARCGSDAAQLQDLDTQLRTTITDLAGKTGLSFNSDRLRNALNTVHARRLKVEQCVAAAHENERLTLFKKFCPEGCNLQQITGVIEQRIRIFMTPSMPGNQQPQPAQPQQKPTGSQ